MFRYFENIVDPYAPYAETDHPPRRLWPFLWSFAEQFRGLFLLALVMSLIVASIEVGLIWYMGRVVDLMEGDPAAVWAAHGFEFTLMALFVVFLRPLMQGLDVLLLNNAILPNFGMLMRWRAHRHVLRQSVGWFENDFAGRIANRIMQAPSSAGEVIFQIFDAITFSLAYFIGAAVVLSVSDPRLLIPLFAWFLLYGLLVRWTVTRVGPASQAAADARSQLTGRLVDAYTNIQSV